MSLDVNLDRLPRHVLAFLVGCVLGQITSCLA